MNRTFLNQVIQLTTYYSHKLLFLTLLRLHWYIDTLIPLSSQNVRHKKIWIAHFQLQISNSKVAYTSQGTQISKMATTQLTLDLLVVCAYFLFCLPSVLWLLPNSYSSPWLLQSSDFLGRSFCSLLHQNSTRGSIKFVDTHCASLIYKCLIINLYKRFLYLGTHAYVHCDQ